MRITLTSVLVDDQAKAERFYVDVLGFVLKDDVPLGEYRWLTVVSPEDPDGPELLLEPSAHPAAQAAASRTSPGNSRTHGGQEVLQQSSTTIFPRWAATAAMRPS